jgi:hypothetical protein
VRDKDSKEFRKSRATELRVLQDVLQTYDVITDPSPLEQAVRMCVAKDGGSEWRYSFTNLMFRLTLDELRHTRPQGVEQLTVSLSVDLQGECVEDKAPTDPFSHLGISIVTQGNDEKNKSFISAWHLDRHEANQTPSPLVHPCYHVHYGGKAILKLDANFDYGSHLLLETPRLAHLPLDGVLAVDFVLSNYMPKTWHKLRDEEARYNDIVYEAQKRCWYAYMMAMSAYWSSSDNMWPTHLLLPQLPKPKK